MTLASGLSWVACGSSLLSLWLYGSRSKWAPWAGLVSQIPWVALGIAAGLGGLIVPSFVYAAIHVRNLFKKH